MKALRIGSVVTVLGLLVGGQAGCRHLGRSVSPGSEHFPLVVGAQWIYEVRSSLGRLELQVVARGEMPLGDELRPFVMEETLSSDLLGIVRRGPVGYVIENGWVSRLAALDYGPAGALRSLGQDAPTRLLPLEPRSGQQWTQENRLFTTPEGGGGRMHWDGEVGWLESLTVPAGTFHDLLEIRTAYRDPAQAGLPVLMRYIDDYAPGVGLVRSLTLDPEGDAAKTIETRLLRYRIP